VLNEGGHKFLIVKSFIENEEIKYEVSAIPIPRANCIWMLGRPSDNED
jgi:hypothetical protein